MFEILIDKLPNSVLKTKEGWLFLLDEKENYFIHFQNNLDKNNCLTVEFETRNESTLQKVNIIDLKEVVYESLIMLGSYNNYNLGLAYVDLLNFYHLELNHV